MAGKTDLSDWEKELDKRLADLKKAAGGVEMRKLQPGSAKGPAQEPLAPSEDAPAGESAAEAHKKALTDSFFDSELSAMEELSEHVEEAPPPDEKPERPPQGRSEFSIAVEDIFSKMVSEVRSAGAEDEAETKVDVQAEAVDGDGELAWTRTEADEFTDAVSRMFRDLADKAEQMVRRVHDLEEERDTLRREAESIGGAVKRERSKAMARVKELESKLTEQGDAHVAEQVRRLEDKLAEAYDVIKLIEEAYLAGLGRR